MKSRILVCMVMAMVLAAGMAHGQHGVSLDEVVGLIGSDSLQCGQPVSFRLRLVNSSLPYAVYGSAHGFRLYSPDGATWTAGIHVDTTIRVFPPPASTVFDTVFYGKFVEPQTPGLVWITTGAGQTPIYDGGIFINWFSADGLGSDTVGFAGFQQTSGVGIYQSFNEVSYQIDIESFDCHGMAVPLAFCLDSSYYRPTGNWLWSGSAIADQEVTPWDGAHCFNVFDPSASGAQLVGVVPNNGDRGTSLGVTITGIDTHFQSGSGTAYVRFEQGSSIINASAFTVANDTSMTAAFQIPASQPSGLYDLQVMTSMDGLIRKINAFTVNQDASQLLANPTALYFIGEPNISLSGSKTIQVSSSGKALNFYVGNLSNWLTVSPASGTTPAVITASLTGFRPAGTYFDTILVVASDNSSQIRIPVQLGVIDLGSRYRVSLDHVDGLVGPDTLATGEPIMFHMRYTGGPDRIEAIVNGFKVSSPNGAQWSASMIDTTGNLGGVQFNLATWLAPFSNDGIGTDTFSYSALSFPGMGMPIGFNDIVTTISIGPIDSTMAGKAICLDSCWFPPAGNWLWSKGSSAPFAPDWDGPHCFAIASDSTSPPPPPPPVDADINIALVNGQVLDSVSILPCGQNITFTIRGRNAYNDDVLGLANGFEIYSPDGALWTPNFFVDTGFVTFPSPGHSTFDTTFYTQWIDPVTLPGVVWKGSDPQIFDGGLFTIDRSVTGSGADTIGMAGFVLTSGTGIPDGFNDVIWTISIRDISCQSTGLTLCIDSAFFPPSGVWKWSLASGPIDGVIPTFSGGKCFTIGGATGGAEPPLSPITFDDLSANHVALTDYANVDWDHPDQYGFGVYGTTNATPYDSPNYVLNLHGKNMIGFSPQEPSYLNGGFFAKCSRSNAVPIGGATSYPVDSIRFHFYNGAGAPDGVSPWYSLKKIPTWIPIDRVISRVVIEHDTIDALNNYFQDVPDAKWFAMDHLVFNEPHGFEPPVYCEDLNNNDICDNQEVPIDSTSITLAYVDGLLNEDTVIAGRVLEFGLRVTNLSSDTYLGIVNGFRIYSPDGATWAETFPDTTGALRVDSMMTLGVFVIPHETDGVGSDTVGFGAVAIPSGSDGSYGLRPGFSEVAYTIQIGPIAASDAGKTICLDSSFFPPTGYWLWSTGSSEIQPTWNGPYCFEIVDAGPPVYPTIACPTDTVTAQAGYDYEFYYTPIISYAETVLVSGPAEANVRWLNGSIWVDGPALAEEVVYPITIVAKNLFGNDTCHINLRVWPFEMDCHLTFYTDVTITGLPYNIIIDPNLVWGCQLAIGDEIGVFDLQQDLLVGGTAYCEPGRPLTITAWKSDPAHMLPGYVAGNPIGFRIYKPDMDQIHGIELCVEAFGTGVSAFESAPYGNVDSMRCVPCEQTFCIPVAAGRWHTVSSPVAFVDPSAPIVFESLQQLDIAQDDDGRVFVPGVVNTMSPVSHFKAFDVFVNGGADDWCVTGVPVRGATIPLKHGRWNAIGYPVTCPLPIDFAMADVIGCIDIVQDDDGRVFIPSIPYNTIGDMTPGAGYKVFLSCNTDTSFQYPICGFTPPPKTGLIAASQPAADAVQYVFTETGLPYTIVLLEAKGSGLATGTEIGVFDGDQCVGGVTYNGENVIAVTAWKSDPKHGLLGFTSGNVLELRAKSTVGMERTLVSAEKGYRFEDGAFASFSLGELVELPTTYALGQNYPNPFNPTTTIEFGLPTAGHVSITIYNVLGQTVRTLVDGPFDGGLHSVVWDGRDDSGQRVSSGIYLYRMHAAGQVLTKKALLLK